MNTTTETSHEVQLKNAILAVEVARICYKNYNDEFTFKKYLEASNALAELTKNSK